MKLKKIIVAAIVASGLGVAFAQDTTPTYKCVPLYRYFVDDPDQYYEFSDKEIKQIVFSYTSYNNGRRLVDYDKDEWVYQYTQNDFRVYSSPGDNTITMLVSKNVDKDGIFTFKILTLPENEKRAIVIEGACVEDKKTSN